MFELVNRKIVVRVNNNALFNNMKVERDKITVVINNAYIESDTCT